MALLKTSVRSRKNTTISRNRMLANKANVIRYVYVGLNVFGVLGAIGLLIFLVVTTQNVPSVEAKYKGMAGVIEDVGVGDILPSLKAQLTTMMLLGIGTVSVPLCLSAAIGIWMSFANNTTVSIVDVVLLFLMFAGSVVLTILALPSKVVFVQFYQNSVIDNVVLQYDGNLILANESVRFNMTPFTVYFNHFMVVNQCCGIDSSEDFNELLLRRYKSLTNIPMACCKLKTDTTSAADTSPATDITLASLMDPSCPARPTKENSNMDTGCLPTIASEGGSAFINMVIIGAAVIGMYAIKLFFSGLVTYFTYDGEYDYVEVDLSDSSSTGSEESSSSDGSSGSGSSETGSSEDEKSNEKKKLVAVKKKA